MVEMQGEKRYNGEKMRGGAGMELLRALGALAFITAVWLLFLVAVGYGFGVGGARQSAWTAPGQRIPGYVELRSPRLARLLVARYGGYNWCAALPLTAWWAWEITRFFWIAPLLGLESGNGLPAAGLTLGLYRLVMGLTGAWNNSRADFGPVLTREVSQSLLASQGKLVKE